MRTPVRALTAAAVALPLAVLATSPSFAAPKPRRTSTDTTAPSVAITTPTPGSTQSDTFTVAGTASDNTQVAAVSVQIDGGSWQPASGTTSWSLPFYGFAAGSHTVSARATDPAGNARTTSVTFTVSGPTPTPSPTPTASPTPSPTATPSPSPSPTATPSPSPSATSTTSTGSAPNAQGTWTSPEGTTISVGTAGSFTIAQVYKMLLDASAGAGDFARIAPMLKVKVQDTNSSGTTSSAVGLAPNYSSFSVTIWLKGVNSVFESYPEMQLTHEYGHAWTLMHLYLDHGGDWSQYFGARWSSADGSVRLGQDSRLGSSYNWDPTEIIADDYRMLFGTPAALVTNHLNSDIVDPRNQPGLKDWFLTTWK